MYCSTHFDAVRSSQLEHCQVSRMISIKRHPKTALHHVQKARLQGNHSRRLSCRHSLVYQKQQSTKNSLLHVVHKQMDDKKTILINCTELPLYDTIPRENRQSENNIPGKPASSVTETRISLSESQLPCAPVRGDFTYALAEIRNVRKKESCLTDS